MHSTFRDASCVCKIRGALPLPAISRLHCYHHSFHNCSWSQPKTAVKGCTAGHIRQLPSAWASSSQLVHGSSQLVYSFLTYAVKTVCAVRKDHLQAAALPITHALCVHVEPSTSASFQSMTARKSRTAASVQPQPAELSTQPQLQVEDLQSLRRGLRQLHLQQRHAHEEPSQRAPQLPQTAVRQMMTAETRVDPEPSLPTGSGRPLTSKTNHLYPVLQL